MIPNSGVIALLTDFGTRDHFVGVMKGVILSIHPHARIVDISHEVDAQDIPAAQVLLQHAYSHFPRGTIFTALVDPGVGTERKAICVETDEYYFLAPDNGILGFLSDRGEARRIFALQNDNLYLQPVSSTFHGRDIFAPVAAHLALGLDPLKLGKPVEEILRLPASEPKTTRSGEVVGRVISIDRFGNLVTNIPADPIQAADALEVRIGKTRIRGLTTAYGHGKKGTLLAIVGSNDTLEIAVSYGSAAKKIRAKVGDTVRLRAR